MKNKLSLNINTDMSKAEVKKTIDNFFDKLVKQVEKKKSTSRKTSNYKSSTKKYYTPNISNPWIRNDKPYPVKKSNWKSLISSFNIQRIKNLIRMNTDLELALYLKQGINFNPNVLKIIIRALRLHFKPIVIKVDENYIQVPDTIDMNKVKLEWEKSKNSLTYFMSTSGYGTLNKNNDKNLN